MSDLPVDRAVRVPRDLRLDVFRGLCLVMIFIILKAIGLTGSEPMVIVGVMLAIDRPLDMFRTAVNVFSDSCGAALIGRSEGEKSIDVS